MATILNEAKQSRGVPPRGRSAAMQGFDLAIDDKTATDIYNRIDATEGLERDVLATQLENWASRKIADNENTAAQEHERIYTDLDGWWSDRGGDEVPEDVKFGAANRKFIADQFNQSASEQGDLYPSYRDQYFLKTYGKAPASESEAYKTISESIAASQKVNQSYDLITGDIALALFDQIDKGTPVDVPALFTKWKEENAEILAALPDDWEANALKAAGGYYAENEKMLREHGGTLQRLYGHIVAATGRKVEGAPENDVKTVEDLNAVIDELGQLPKEVRDRGYTAILMAARRQGMEDKGFWEMAAEAWPRTLNTVRTTGLVAQETDAEAKVNLLRGDNPIFINKANGQVTPPSGTAFSPQDFEPVTDEQRGELLQQAETELQRFNVIRELRDLADNRFDPVKSNAKNGVLKFVQDIALMGPQSLGYTAMAAVPVAGPFLTGAAIYADEYNQLRLEGMSPAQARTLSLVSAPLQTAAEVFGAKLLFGRYKWYRETIQKLINPARFARSSQAAVSFFGKVVGENITEGFQDLATPLVKDVASALSEEYPDVNWEETLGRWKDSRLEVMAATLMPVIGGSLVETFNNNERFASAKRRVQLLYKPMGITDEEVRHIEDGTTPEERTKRYTETLSGMSAERVQAVKDNIASQSRVATGTQEDATQPTLETQKDTNGRLTYIVRDETGKEVYRSTKQAAAEEAFILTSARSTAARFNEEKVQLRELVEWWNTADPKRADNEERVVRDTMQGTAQQKLEALQQANNKQGIEELHRRIAQSPYAGTPYDQIQILGEASVEQVGEMVFRSVIALNKNSRVRDAREEMHHTAVRMAVANGRASEQTMREWLDATERVFAEKGLGITLPRADMTDIVESMAVVQEAFENERISADVEMSLPQAFVDYIKRMIQVLAEVLKRGKAIREALDAGALPAEFEAFLVETTGVADQTAVDRARERTEQEVGAGQNYSIGVSSQQSSVMVAAAEKQATEDFSEDLYGNEPYINHLRRVAEQMPNDKLKAAAFLHDSVEDEKMTLNEIRSKFGNAVAGLVDAVSRKDGETYEQFINRVAKNPEAAQIKLADLRENIRNVDEFRPSLRSRYERAISTRSSVTAQDTDYLAAVERGDMEMAQRMVDEAARAAGYVEAGSHGLALGELANNRFDPALLGTNTRAASAELGYFFASEKTARNYGLKTLNAERAVDVSDVARGIVQPLLDLIPVGVSKEFDFIRQLDDAAFMPQSSDMYDSDSFVESTYDYVNVLLDDAEFAADELPNEETVLEAVETARERLEATLGQTQLTSVTDAAVLNVRLKMQNPAIHDQQGQRYRERSFFEIINAAKEAGNDSVIIQNTYDGGPLDDVKVVFDPTQIKSADPVTYDASGNVIPLSQRFDATTADINYSIGVRFDEIAKEDPKHDGSRVGTAWQGKVKPTTQDTNDGVATVTPKELEKQMAMLTHFVDGVPLPKYITKFRNAEKRMRAFIDFQKGNLLALYDAFDSLSADYVIRSTHWYDGARLLAEGIRDRYNLTVEQSSAIMAVFSPMKDWFQNVAMGQRFADVMANYKDIPVNKVEMGGAIDEMLNAAADAKYVRKAFSLIEGKSITDLLADKSKEGRKLAAVAVRLVSTHVHGLTHDVLSPEGESLGIRKNLDGSNKKMVWQSYAFIEKAISIYEDGSLENISKTLGTEHKIRNFYNNIVAPTSPYGDATVDTHAVNAAVLYPMGGSAYLTTLNFGSAGVAGGGNSGIYWLFHEALREAAAERGVMPRQMQSITWEAIRGLFTDVRKRDKNFVATITKIWEDSTDANAARTQIIGLGITPPEWARVGGSDSGGERGVGESVGQIADTAGSVRSGVRQGRQSGNQGAGVDNYSISTQSEIDRVQAAMDRLARSPSERIAQYAALKERLAAALERNKPIMQSMRGDTLPQDFDRTRILNDLGFLDYILKVLPPEVRGRVGGYTNLAAIAPVDVYKGDQKVSEAKNPAGAIISAWMREGQNIGQAQKNTALPEGYSTVANTTDERRDKTVANFLIDRLKKIDRELERYYKRDLMERIFDVLDKSRPKAGQSGVKRSTLGAETQKFADMVYRASLLDDEKTPKRLAAIEAEITSIQPKDTSPEAVAESQKLISQLSEEWTIVNTFGDLKSRSSETLASGLEWLRGQLKAGREAWQIKEAARIQENRERAAKVVAFLGKPTDVGRFKNKSTLQRFLQNINAFDLDHKSFEQLAFWLFGDEVSAELSKKMMRAQINEAKAELDNMRLILAALREGAKAAGITRGRALALFKENQPNAVRKLQGRKVRPVEISIELAKKIVRGLADRGSLSNADVQTLADELAALPRDTRKENVTIQQVIFRGEEVRLTLSRGQAMQLWLTWQQTDAQEKMRADGFNDDSFEDLDNLISDPFSQAVLRVTQRIYGSGYPLTNPIYARMFGMNMPMVKNYAPARYQSNKDIKDVALDGTALTAGGQPSFAKSRVNHTAKLAPDDALTVLQSHIAQQAHWVAFAEVTREYRSLLANPEVREAIRQRFGEDVLRTADMWGDQMEQRGGNKGREIAWIQNMLGALIGGQSVSLLGYNLKSLAMQTDNFMRFFLALDSRQIAEAMANPAGLFKAIKKVWKTDIIQTRLEGGATAETRFFFERFVSMFRRGARVSELSMMPMNYSDSAGLSVSGAIVYEAAYKDAIDSGMDERSADQTAKDAVEAMVYRYGQPVLMGQKSNIENSGNAFTKAFFLFMSDPRLKMAIISDSVRGLATGRGDWKAHVRRIVAIEMMAVVAHVLATGFRDLTSDDEDEDLWSMGGFARALLLAPFQGYFLLGSASDLVLSRLTEAQWFTPTQNPLIRTVETGYRALGNLDNAFNFDDPDALVKEWTDITRSIAVAPPLAAPAVIMNLVRPLVQGWERMDDDE